MLRDNGGSTAPGVTNDTITVVFYLAAEQDIVKQLELFGVFDGSDATLEGVGFARRDERPPV